MLTYSPIHKAAGSLVTGRSLQNGKMSMGNRRTERPPDPVLYGGRPSGGFVNRAVKPPNKNQLAHRASTCPDYLTEVVEGPTLAALERKLETGLKEHE